MRQISVLGFGNILMRDDGLGPYVIQMLEASYEFGEEVTVLDIGTPGLGIDQYLARLDEVIIIDTVRATGKPGDVRTYRMAEILRHPPGLRMSPHDPGLKEALLHLQFVDAAPKEVLLIGVIPEDVSTGTGLSSAVRDAAPLVVAEVFNELLRLGVPIRKRSNAHPLDVWWEPQPAAERRL